MTKQEFLAISLPYQLKVYDCIGNSIELVDYSKGCPKCVCEAIGQVKNEDKCVNVFQAAYDKQLKPILYPLSDLTNPIEHNGEKFVPINEIVSHPLSYYDDKEDALISIYNYPEQMRWWTIKILIKWHFDIAGLIEKGEAIDINTLQENPYK